LERDIKEQIDELSQLSIQELRERWRTFFNREPPYCQREYLIRRLAYRIQEIAFGGLSQETRNLLRKLAKEYRCDLESNSSSAKARQGKALPLKGTRIVREWQGRTYEVMVGETDYIYEGRHYRSLSVIAREITGTRWNGPVFFGLRKGKQEAAK